MKIPGFYLVQQGTRYLIMYVTGLFQVLGPKEFIEKFSARVLVVTEKIVSILEANFVIFSVIWVSFA